MPDCAFLASAVLQYQFGFSFVLPLALLLSHCLQFLFLLLGFKFLSIGTLRNICEATLPLSLLLLPKRLCLVRIGDELAVMSDGHVRRVKIYWNGDSNSPTCNYEPPTSYDYDWDGK
ncbi:MAG TPA: hypothetical protein VKY92_01045 [Verrucomicrobiae bacterium]|nr:hypothetical protein [Verrucomicrobiae bacterium]